MGEAEAPAAGSRAAGEVVAVPPGLKGARIATRDVTRTAIGEPMDPFLVVSRFEMRGPVFPPHPHAGFAVMTYILPESETGFRNQDSTGFSNVIAPGELHVTVAGRGLQHEETNLEDGRAALGLQIWIDLPAAHRQDAPSAFHLTGERVPVLRDERGTLRVLAGASNGMASPVSIPTRFRLIDAALEPGARFEQELAASETAFLLVLSGSARLGDRLVRPDEAAFTRPGGTRLTLSAGPEGARLVLLAGERLGQRPVLGGPFVASSAQELRGFRRAHAAGAMGPLVAFADQVAGS